MHALVTDCNLSAPQITASNHEPSGLVAVRVEDLIVGRHLSAPVYDGHGVLLLAQGSVITSDFKRLLRNRGDGSIHADPQDAQRLQLQPVSNEPVRVITFDADVTNRLDRLVDQGLLRVENTGAAMKGRCAVHGRSPFNAERESQLQLQSEAQSESLGDLLKAALRGNSIQSADVTAMAADSLTDLTRDTDGKLSVALRAIREQSLADHCLKMSTLGMALAIELGMDEENCTRVGIAGLLHDWGMGAVPEELRTANRTLTEREMFEIRKHPCHTVDMLEKMNGVPPVVPLAVYQVHEQPNGRGYPRGRVGRSIHHFARILAVADSFAALTSPRPHRAALSPYAAMECVVKLARKGVLDSATVRALLRVMSLFPIGSYVGLSDNRVARVIRRNGDRYATPIVQIVQDADGAPVDPENPAHVLDLSDCPLSVVQALPTPGRNEQGLTDEVLAVPRAVN